MVDDSGNNTHFFSTGHAPGDAKSVATTYGPDTSPAERQTVLSMA